MKKGFTLVELLIVIMIIGILATMAVPQYNKMVEKARWVEVIQTLGQVRQASILYYQEHRYYPNGASYVYLNQGLSGADQAGLLVDIPAPKAGAYKFIYTLVPFVWLDDVEPGYAPASAPAGEVYLAFGFNDINPPDNAFAEPEPYISIYLTGHTYSTNNAPKFN